MEKKINYYAEKVKGRRLLKDIVKGYACNLMASRRNKRDDLDEGEIEFPVYLLHDIDKELIFSSPKNNYPILEKHSLPTNLDLVELVKYFKSDFGRMKSLNGWRVDKIKNLDVIGKAVHLDVIVRKY